MSMFNYGAHILLTLISFLSWRFKSHGILQCVNWRTDKFYIL